VADDRDQIALVARLHPQHAEAALVVVEGDPFDQPGEVLAFECCGWSAGARMFHDDR
jgi:hypothetical protein